MEKVKAFQFDIDGNIFHLETESYIKIKKGRKWVNETVTAEQFAAYLSDKSIKMEYNEESFPNFRRDDRREEDFSKMLYGDPTTGFGFVEPDLRDALLHVEEVSINTSRGHSSHAIKKSIKEYILHAFDQTEKEYMMNKLRQKLALSSLASFDYALDDYFKYKFRVYAARSQEINELLGFDTLHLPVEAIKPLAYQHYIDYLTEKYGNDRMISVGFSEDTQKYVERVAQHIKDVILPSQKYNHVYQVLYHTLSPMESRKIVLRPEGVVRKNLLMNGL